MTTEQIAEFTILECRALPRGDVDFPGTFESGAFFILTAYDFRPPNANHVARQKVLAVIPQELLQSELT